MKKPIENRDIFKKLLLIMVIVCLVTFTLFSIVACSKIKYEDNSCLIEFSEAKAVFTIPKQAKIRVDKKIKNYVYEQIIPKKQKSMGNLVQYVFENNSNSIFRIEKNGYITKSGYFAATGKFEIKFNNNEDIWQSKEYEKALPNGLAGIDDIMLTNVGDNYFKVLKVGEVFDLKAFRNTMIIDNSANNTEIEPDFDAEILSGESISIEKQNENTFKVKAKSQGVTQIKLRYQAIEVLNRGKLFCYNASDKKREVVLTFAVGENFTTDIFVKAQDRNFDSEFDIIYFDKDETKFEIESDADYIKSYNSDICNSGVIKKSNNKFALPIVEGVNCFELVKNNESCYMTIYGKKINVQVENYQEKISVGDKIKIKVFGVYTAVPKVGGIYNPTQEYNEGSTKTVGSKMKFVLPNEEVPAKYQSQYYSGANCTVEFVVKTEYLVNGKLTFDLKFCYEWWGSDLGAHRSITSKGIEDNLNAKLWERNLGFFILN